VVREGNKVEQGKVFKLYGFSGLKRVEIADAGPGELVSVAGIEQVSIGDTLADPESPVALPRITVDEPTMMMIFRVNDGPLAGREGKYVTSRNLRERLYREAYRNVSIRVEDTDTPDAFRVVGRGELQLAVIIETMRREGYELTASNPEPITREVNEQVHEPMELMVCDLPEASVGAVTERLGPRKGRMTDMSALGSGRTRLTFRIPARGLVGFRSEFLTITRGEGIMSSQFDGYEPWFGYIPKRSNGAIVSDRQGDTVPYALFSIQERGTLFIGPGVQVYEGMIIGENAHPSDLNVNACREKKLTNIRAAGRDENVILTAPGDVAGAGAGVDRSRRAGRGHAEVGADAQAGAGHRRAVQGRPGPEARSARVGMTGASCRPPVHGSPSPWLPEAPPGPRATPPRQASTLARSAHGDPVVQRSPPVRQPGPAEGPTHRRGSAHHELAPRVRRLEPVQPRQRGADVPRRGLAYGAKGMHEQTERVLVQSVLAAVRP
jgi:hypothetical protein